MPRLTPLKSDEVIVKLRKLGYEGPYGGGRHLKMRHPTSGHSVPVPYHKGQDIQVGLLRSIIRSVGITVEEWLDL